jgi:uncharacterized phage protein (TIGR02220 family)
MSKEPNINKFIELNFIESTVSHGGVNMASTWRQHDQPEKSRVEKSRVETEADICLPVNGKPPHQKIIEYLNEKTSKAYRYQSKETQALINTRMKAGFTVEDFYKVIDNKVAKWLLDPKMAEYLRPQTLFGTKFESYLQDIPHPLQGKVSNKTIKNMQVLENWRPPDEE